MRMIFPLVLILLGGLCGLIVRRWISSSGLSPQISAVCGVIGAFMGLLARDIADIGQANKLLATLAAGLIGAVIAALVANLMVRRH